MLLRNVNLVSCALAVLSVLSCNRPQIDNRNAILTGNGKGKYWDLVCSNNGLNRYNQEIWPGRSHTDELKGIPSSTLLFAAKHKLRYYMNLDSTTIIDMNTVAGDIQYNPATYKLMDNKIELIGDTSEILLLSEEVMVLRQLRRGYIKVYIPSRWQEKTESEILKFR